ncbi:MAG: hypothetical protein Q8R36_03385, partial [bacterium]|nr:hypothetical protein [bacterium]
IIRARVLMEKLPLRLHEKGDAERVLMALRKYKTRSKSGSWIVLSGFFPQVHGDADVQHPTFYIFLKDFEKRGFIEIVRDQYRMKEKILFVTLLTPAL